MGQAATKLRQRTPEERRRGAGRSARNESPRHTAWIAYQSLVFALWVPSGAGALSRRRSRTPPLNQQEPVVLAVRRVRALVA